MNRRPILFVAIPILFAILESPSEALESALLFKGAQVLSAPAVPLTQEHTVELWIRIDAPIPPASAPAVILDWGGVVSIKHSETGLDYIVNLDGPGPIHAFAQSLSPDGKWHHLAVSYDGLQLLVLMDGKIAGTKFSSGQILKSGELDASFGAPLRSTMVLSSFLGRIDEIRIWNFARTLGEIEETMVDHLGGNEDGLIAYWDLDEGSGQTADDLAGTHPGFLGDTTGPDGRDPEWTSEIAPVRKPDPGFLFGLIPLGPISKMSGEPFGVDFELTSIQGATIGGVTAWQIAVRHERKHLILENFTLEGTAADLIKADGFAKVEILDDGVISGFDSKVVLSQAGGTALPPAGTWKIAKARYHGVLDYEEGAVTAIRYDDRLPPGELGPPRNIISADGAEKRPAEGMLSINLTAPAFSLAFDPEAVQVLPGGEISVLSTLTTTGNQAETGVGSWSISVAHDPGVLELIEATTSGTSLDAFPPDETFRLVETVSNPSGTGFISVAILNMPTYYLPVNGKSSIAKARYKVRGDAALGTATRITYTDGLQGSGVPIDNQINFIGGNMKPRKGEFPIEVSGPVFVRGDGNGDGKVNLSDAIAIVDIVFRGKVPRCADAADANDDERINISDPIFLVNKIFHGGPQPPPPYPGPGADPTPGILDCKAYP